MLYRLLYVILHLCRTYLKHSILLLWISLAHQDILGELANYFLPISDAGICCVMLLKHACLEDDVLLLGTDDSELIIEMMCMSWTSNFIRVFILFTGS